RAVVRASSHATTSPVCLTGGSDYFGWTDGEDLMFKRVGTSEKELRDLMGTPSERAIKKESPFIDAPSREFIAHAPFLLLATADAADRCHVSPNAGAPGFVRVLPHRHPVHARRPRHTPLEGLDD